MSTKISIDIGSKNIHIAEGDFQKGLLTVQGSQSFELPSSCVSAETIEDSQLLADTIKSSLKAGQFSAKDAIITTNATHAIIRELDFPKAKPKELDQMIKTELYQTFHVLNTDIIQYKEIAKVESSDGDMLDRYRVAAIDQDYVNNYYNILELTGLKAIAMDLNINGIDKLLGWADSINEKPLDDNTVMLVDFGHSATTVYIYKKGQPMFYRHLNIGSSEIDNLLKNTFYIQDSEAKALKEKMEFFGTSTEAVPYFEALKPFFYHLNDEIRKLIAFYTNRSKESSVNYCYLFGQGAGILGLDNYWSISMNMPVEKIQSISKANATVKLLNPEHLNAIAALIRYQD